MQPTQSPLLKDLLVTTDPGVSPMPRVGRNGKEERRDDNDDDDDDDCDSDDDDGGNDAVGIDDAEDGDDDNDNEFTKFFQMNQCKTYQRRNVQGY